MREFAGGAALLLGLLLASAGLLKLVRPRPFVESVHRLLPERLQRTAVVSRAAAPIVGAAELLVAAGLLATPWLPAAAAVTIATAAAALFVGFSWVVTVAIRKGAACGCWSSFSLDAAGGGELGRTVALAAISGALVATEAAGGPVRGWSWEFLAWLPALVAWIVACYAGAQRRLSAAVAAR